MVGKYKVITLCGSTRFKEAFMGVQKRLTLEGNIVISVGLFGHSGDDEVWRRGTKEMLDDMHKRKIDMADEIFVVNVGGYIGSSTRSEIEYAKATGKAVHYLENSEDCSAPNIRLDDAMRTLKRRKRDIQRYYEIMEMADQPESPVFQKKYDAFYRVRRNETWRKDYFCLMGDYRKHNENPPFGIILLRIFQKTNRVEASFTSKMLATLNADMPIWDSNVLNALNLKLTGTTPEMKLSNAVVLYDRICQWYSSFLPTEAAKQMIERFDRELPEYADISPTKKIDFILWANA